MRDGSAAASARAAFAAGDFEAAARLFGDAMHSACHAGEQHHLLCNRSAALVKCGRFAEAVEDAELAIASSPDNVKAHYRRAQALEGMGSYRLGEQACADALRLDPGHVQVAALLAQCQKSRAAAEDCRSCSAPEAGQGATANEGDSRSAATAVPDGSSYVTWCRETAAGFASASQHGQACAWYGHALVASESEQTPPVEQARLLADRAVALSHLSRYEQAAADCARAIELDCSLVDAHVCGAVALLQLGAWPRHASEEVTAAAQHVVVTPALALLAGRMDEAERLARAAVAAARPAPEPRAARLHALQELSVRKLGARLRSLRSASVCGEGSAAEAERARPLEKADLVGEVEAAEREADALGEVVARAERTLAEVEAMRERVEEVAQMARRSEWEQVLEHACWLMRQYERHRALRQLRLEALQSLERFDEATLLNDEILQVLRSPTCAGDPLHAHSHRTRRFPLPRPSLPPPPSLRTRRRSSRSSRAAAPVALTHTCALARAVGA